METYIKIKRIWMPINMWVNNQNVILAFSGNLLGNEKNWLTDKCNTLNEKKKLDQKHAWYII